MYHRDKQLMPQMPIWDSDSVTWLSNVNCKILIHVLLLWKCHHLLSMNHGHHCGDPPLPHPYVTKSLEFQHYTAFISVVDILTSRMCCHILVYFHFSLWCALFFKDLRSTVFRWGKIKGTCGYRDEFGTRIAKMVFLKRKL